MAPLCQFLLVLIFALRPAAAAEAPIRLYEPASSHWAATVQTPLAAVADPGTPLSAIEGLEETQRAAALGPIVFELQHSLNLSPEAFARMDHASQVAAFSMAAEQARDEIVQKSFELVGESNGLVWSNDSVDREQLAKLHLLASRLQEVNRHYGAFLSDKEREAVALTSAQTSSRYLAARAAYLGQVGKATADALGQDGQRAPPGAELDARADGAAPFTPSPKARKLLERMKETKSGWGEKDLETVYVGYGFSYRDGAKHRIYFHPVFTQLRTTVSRQASLPPGYAVDAVKLIAEAEALSAPAAIPALAAAADVDLPPVPLSVAKPAVVKPAKSPVTRIAETPRELAPLAETPGVAVEEKPSQLPAPPQPGPKAEPEPESATLPASPTMSAWDKWRARFKGFFGS